ncbi:MAG: beta-lactamase family protein [Roseicyclus sp.]|nr:beta-lactamase family protein [Roseicyclus sp.]
MGKLLNGKWVMPLLAALGVAPGGVMPANGQAAPADVADALAAHSLIPAAVAGRVTADILDFSVAGERVIEGGDPALLADVWHVGSLTKSMTATLAARMVAAGQIRWNATVGEVLGGTIPEIDPAWNETSLRAFLTHRSGLTANLSRASTSDLGGGPRREYVAEILSEPPDQAPGDFLYSNAGYVVAGAMLEAVGGAPWEQLIVAEVFAPLGMDGAGFGPPQGAVIEGHATRLFGGLRSAGQGVDADNIPAVGPAGRVHLSAQDMLRYLQAHLLQDEDYLSAELWAILHAPVGEEGYAMGWGVGEDGSLVHSGSNTLWYAVGYVDPAAGEAVFVAVNTGDVAVVVEPVNDALTALLSAAPD